VRMIVVGAGRLGADLAAELAAAGNEVTHVESGPPDQPVGGAGSARTLAADPLDPATLEEAGALRADVLVVCTSADHDNLAVAVLAKRRFDVPRVVVLLNEAGNSWLFDETWGVDAAVSASASLMALVEEATGGARRASLDLLTDRLNLLEATVGPRSPEAYATLAELGLPAGAVVAAVVRAGVALVPGASFRLAEGDQVLIVAEPGRTLDLDTLFGAQAEGAGGGAP